jgi:hypothetical protein
VLRVPDERQSFSVNFSKWKIAKMELRRSGRSASTCEAERSPPFTDFYPILLGFRHNKSKSNEVRAGQALFWGGPLMHNQVWFCPRRESRSWAPRRLRKHLANPSTVPLPTPSNGRVCRTAVGFFAAQLKLCVAALARGKKRKRHMSLIEDREVQQLYNEIMRQPEAALQP